MNLKLLKPLKVNLMWPSLNVYVFYELFNVSVLFAQLALGSLTAKFPAIWSMNQAIKYLVWSELVFRKFSSSCFSPLDIMRPRQHRTTDQQCLVARLQTGCSQTEMATESSAGCKWTHRMKVRKAQNLTSFGHIPLWTWALWTGLCRTRWWLYKGEYNGTKMRGT